MANTSVIVKKANTALVLRSIRSVPSLTIGGIVGSTGLSRPTVVMIVRELEDDRLVRKAGQARAEAGRQPYLYALDDSARFAVGIDIDGPPARLALTDLKGNARFQLEWQFGMTESYEQVVEILATRIAEALTQGGVEASQIVGIGLGLPAAVDLVSNRAINVSRPESLREAPVAADLEAATGIPVLVRNDSHLIALAEDSGGEGEYLYIIFRAGVGMATVVDSQVYAGQTGNSGFIGHMNLVPDGPLCSCGARGCVEAVVSKRSIVDQWSATTGRETDYLSLLDEAIAEPGGAAERHLVAAGRWLGLAVANLVTALDIYTVIIGDLECDEHHPFFRSIVESVDANTSHYLPRRPVVRLGRIAGADFALGGANLVIDRFFATPRLRLKAW